MPTMTYSRKYNFLYDGYFLHGLSLSFLQNSTEKIWEATETWLQETEKDYSFLATFR